MASSPTVVPEQGLTYPPLVVADKLLARMLHSCYGSVERTKTTVDNYVTITTHAPEIFGNRAALDQRFQSQMKIM